MVNRELRLIVAGRIIFCSQRRNKEQPRAAVRNKQEAEDPYHVSALPLNLAKGETSVSYLLKRRGKPGGGKRINQIPNCFKSEPGCVPFPVHTGGSWRKMYLSYLKACRGVWICRQYSSSTTQALRIDPKQWTLLFLHQNTQGMAENFWKYSRSSLTLLLYTFKTWDQVSPLFSRLFLEG